MFDMNKNKTPLVAVVGAGPAGLFAAECLLEKGFAVSLYDRMPSSGRKFLIAGSCGGLNITNAAQPTEFAARYGENQDLFARLLAEFSSADLIEWLSGLGIGVHQGSGGKIFPEGQNTAEILSRWMDRLCSHSGFAFYPGYSLERLGPGPCLCFATSTGPVDVKPDAAVFALGGASWPTTGSNGKWKDVFERIGIPVSPFFPANCGFEADWPASLATRFDNIPLKNVALTACGKQTRGELMLTPYGLEGGPVYTLCAVMRGEIQKFGSCTITLDLLPGWTHEKIVKRLEGGSGKESLSNFYRKRLGIVGPAFSLLRAMPNAAADLRDSELAATLVKALPVKLFRTRPIEESISSAGGVAFRGLDEYLMLKDFPGWFCAGEMLDWEAPTGGFLLQGCFSTAHRAALGVAAWLEMLKK